MSRHHHYCGGEAATFIARTAQPYHVFIASPSGRGFPVGYVMSLVGLIETLTRFGIRFDFHVLADDCHVDDARNGVVREFRKTECTDLFFIDSDIASRPQDFIKLLHAEGDIVAGIYRHKDQAETYPFHPGEQERDADADGLYSMPKVPTGFMRVRRRVIEALHTFEEDRGRWFWDSVEDERSGNPVMTAVFERTFRHEMGFEPPADAGISRRNSGDYSFCIKARHLGFSVRADIELEFGHIGEQEFRGCLGDALRRAQGVDHPQFIAAVDALKSGADTAATFEALNAHSGNASCALPGPALRDCWRLAKGAHGHILELGSGISTLVMGLALAGTGRVLHTFESDLVWFHRISKMLRRHDVRNVVLHYVPLMSYDGFDWYGYSEEMGLPGVFDVVLIDGPERSKGQRAGAFRVIPHLLESARVWFVDDVGDPAIASMLAEHGGDRAVYRGLGVSAGIPHQYAIATRAAA